MFNFFKTFLAFNPIIFKMPSVQELLLQLLAEPIASQTDAGSPLNYALMEAIRTSLGVGTIGSIIYLHDFNGLLSAPAKYMQCNGSLINETNYNAGHTTTWANDISKTPIDGKYLPNLPDKYIITKDTTSQNGDSAITFVGNSNNQVNLAHTHTIASHNHNWCKFVDDKDSDDYSYDENGNSRTWGSQGYSGDGSGITSRQLHSITKNEFVYNIDQDYYTHKDSTNPDNSLSTTQDIKPHSLELEAWMKIV